MADDRLKPQMVPVFVWWVIWAGILSGMPILRFFVADGAPLKGGGSVLGYICIAPLVASCGLRWWFLSKQQKAGVAFVIFVAGAALAESCGILGIFLGGEQRDELFIFGVLGVLQWAPFFARRFPRFPVAQTSWLV